MDKSTQDGIAHLNLLWAERTYSYVPKEQLQEASNEAARTAPGATNVELRKFFDERFKPERVSDFLGIANGEPPKTSKAPRHELKRLSPKSLLDLANGCASDFPELRKETSND